MKRVQLIPLILLIWCAGISLSSGLYFYEVKGSVYLIPISLILALYYFLRFFLREQKRKDAICFWITLAASLICMWMFRSVVIPGLCLLFNEISDKVYLSYGINIGEWIVEGDGSLGLAVCQLVAIVTVLSLYLYETRRPVVVTAFPSFLLFFVSIIADGVPYEMCMILYAGAFIVFVGMGRKAGGIKKFVTLVSCTVLVAAAASVCVPWSAFQEQLEEYREQLSEGTMFQSTKTSEDDERKQRINFGQFNREGNITYTGTVELYVTSLREFTKDKLFLWNFRGTSYRENRWYDDNLWAPEDGSWSSNVFPVEPGINIQPAYDTEEYFPYTVEPDEFEELMNRECGISERTLTSFMESVLVVNEPLRTRIEQEVLKGKKDKVKTIGDAVDIVRQYFGDGFQYTLQPGAVEKDIDEVQRFLFTTKQGYCTHFASGAVMMFRTMGIPARIVQGYVVAGERLEKDKKVSVTDNNAHAWAEIYVDNEGWLPLDVTSYIWNEAGQEWNNGEHASVRKREPVRTKEPDVEEEEKEKETPRAKRKNRNVKRAAKKAKEPEPEEVLQSFVQYGIVFLGIGLIAAAGYGMRRRRQYLRLRKTVHTGNYGERLLAVNDGLKRFWKDLGMEWDYMDSAVRSGEIFWQTRKYYVMGTQLEMIEIQEQIRRYVQCVYISRYGKNGISESDYEASLEYLFGLLANIKERTVKKNWKKLQRCPMVKLLEEMRMEDGHERT